MFYVGVCRYFATGEGLTIYVASGSEESIRKVIQEYFHQRLTILTPSDWLKAANGDSFGEYEKSHTRILKMNLPLLWKQIEELGKLRLRSHNTLNFFIRAKKHEMSLILVFFCAFRHSMSRSGLI